MKQLTIPRAISQFIDRHRGGYTYPTNTGDRWVMHRHGTPWHAAPVPPRLHFCTPQTCIWPAGRPLGEPLVRTERCACGGRRIGDGPWTHRNSQRNGGLPHA
jgi:hypothetical protein